MSGYSPGRRPKTLRAGDFSFAIAAGSPTRSPTRRAALSTSTGRTAISEASIDHVRPVLSSTCACLGLERTTRTGSKPPLVQTGDGDSTRTRLEAWQAGEWDANWMCWDCASGIYGHRPGWMINVNLADFVLAPNMPAADAPLEQHRRRRPTASRRGGVKCRKTKR